MGNNSDSNNPCGNLSWKIKRANREIKRYIDNRLSVVIDREAGGITAMQGMILHYLSSQPEGTDVFQRDLEKQFNTGRSTVTGILQLMEQNDLIRRESVPQDARLKKLVLTPKAYRIQQEIHNTIMEMEEKLRKDIAPEELETVERVLEKIRKNLRDEGKEFNETEDKP